MRRREKEGGSAQVRSCHVEDGVGGGGLASAGHAAGRDGQRSSLCGNAREGKGRRGGSGQGGSRLGRCHGPAQAHSADFD
jgi:hypothetical protein